MYIILIENGKKLYLNVNKIISVMFNEQKGFAYVTCEGKENEYKIEDKESVNKLYKILNQSVCG